MARRLRAHSLDSQKEDSGMDHPTTSAQNGGRATSLSDTESRQADEAAAVPLAPAARAVGREAGPRSPSGSGMSPHWAPLATRPGIILGIGHSRAHTDMFGKQKQREGDFP